MCEPSAIAGSVESTSDEKKASALGIANVLGLSTVTSTVTCCELWSGSIVGGGCDASAFECPVLVSLVFLPLSHA